MELNGKVHHIGEVESVGQNGFTKRLLVIETNEQYPQKLPIDFVKEKTNLLDGIAIGKEVKVQTNLRGSESNGRYFVQIQGWKID